MKKYLSIIFLLISHSAFALSYQNLPDPMTFQYYGAACDNSTDDSAIINQVIGYALHSGHCIHIVGSCRATSQQINVDLNGFESTGICIYGDGTAGLSRLELEGNSSNPPFIVHDSAGGSVGALFARIGEKGSFDIQTNNASGPGVQLGNHDFSDAINSSVFNINVHNNASSGSNVAAIEVNWVLQSEIKGLSGNSGTLGDAIRIRQAQFVRFFGSYGGAAVGVHITDGNSFSNTLESLDVEADTTDIIVDSSTAYANTFLNPQLSHWTSGTHISTTAGSTLFINPNFYENTGQIGSSTGLFVMGPGHNMPSGYPNYPTGSGGSPAGSSGNIQYNNSGVFGALTDTQLTTHINSFSSSLAGSVPSSGGGTTNFMRADGTWAVPAGISTPVSVANGGTGTASPGIVAGANVTVTGSWPNQTIAASSGGGSGTSIATQGSFKNLKVAYASTTTFTTTADELIVEASGTSVLLNSVNQTCTTTTSGAGGLDTGSIATNTIYYDYIEYNGSTTACLFSTSATSPTLSSGYTYFARTGAFRTDGSSHVIGFTQLGRNLQYKVGSNLSAAIQLASGSAGSVGTPTYSSLSLTSYVPSTASRVRGALVVQSGPMTCMIAPNSSYGPYSSTTNPPPVLLSASSGQSLPFDFLLEATSLQWASSGAGCAAYLTGYEDNL